MTLHFLNLENEYGPNRTGPDGCPPPPGERSDTPRIRGAQAGTRGDRGEPHQLSGVQATGIHTIE